MRILVIGDSHEDLNSITKAIKQAGDIQMLLHTGDFLTDMQIVQSHLKAEGIDLNFEIHAVAGNCDGYKYGDTYSNNFIEKIIEIQGIKIYLCHGHKYSVKRNLSNLYYRTEEIGAQIAVFGHTHIPTLIQSEGITLFNPGSISKPVGINKPTYGIIEIDSVTGVLSFFHKKLD